jgi:hypothetical protein
MSRSASIIVTLIIVLTWTTSALAQSTASAVTSQYKTGYSSKYNYQAPENVDLAIPCSYVFCQPLTASIEDGHDLDDSDFVAGLWYGSDQVGSLFFDCPDYDDYFASEVEDEDYDIYYDFCFMQAQITCSNNGRLVSIPISFNGFINYVDYDSPPYPAPNVFVPAVGGFEPFNTGVVTISSLDYYYDELSVQFALTDCYGNPYCADEPVLTNRLTGYFGYVDDASLQNQLVYSSVPAATQATQFSYPQSYNNYGTFNSYPQPSQGYTGQAYGLPNMYQPAY